MQTIRIPNEWTPRPYQLPVLKYIDQGGRRAVLKWHRRSGKDDLALHLTAAQMFKRKGTYWHVLPSYAQARKAIWDAVDPKKGIRRIDWAFPKILRERTNEQEMKITLKNGSVWQLLGSDNYDELVGSNPVGVVFSEYALCKPEAWSYISPILEENNGYAIFISTVRGENHFTELYRYAENTPAWFASRVDADKSGVFTPSQLENIREELARVNGEEFGLQIFRQEYLNDSNAVTAVNAVFSGKEIENLKRACPLFHTRIGRTMGVDIARFGDNENVAHILDHYADGSAAEFCTETWKGMDAVFTQGKIFELIKRYEVDVVNIDCDGLGGPVLDNIRALCNNYDGYGGKERAVINEYHNTKTAGPYANLTTENYFKSKECAALGKLFLRDPYTISQLTARKFLFTRGQKILESKKEWKSSASGSPDRADAHVMALAAADMLTALAEQNVSGAASYDVSFNFGY